MLRAGPRRGVWYVAVLSDPVQSPPAYVPLGKGTHDDADWRIRYQGAWHRDRQFAEDVNHTIVYVDDPGASARFDFEGPAFRWIHTRAANRGRAAVSIDGATAIEVNLHLTGTSGGRRSGSPRHRAAIRS